MSEELEGNELFQCSNEECEVIFARPSSLLLWGDWSYTCPECMDPFFMILPKPVVTSIFHHIIMHDWDLGQRNVLRIIAENEMAPFDRADRDR